MCIKGNISEHAETGDSLLSIFFLSMFLLLKIYFYTIHSDDSFSFLKPLFCPTGQVAEGIGIEGGGTKTCEIWSQDKKS